MWAVGVAFGRWDLRMALDPTLLPALQGPFDPLPRCAPGALINTRGLPPQTAAEIAPESWLRARKTVLDLPPSPAAAEEGLGEGISWDGILVDDPTHPRDIVARVQAVLQALWGDRAEAIEQEICDILNVRDLRAYFRDPRKGFFAFHIKRYSKSRRKAPIYWLLQSQKRNYAIWLYSHRLHQYSLYEAARSYADVKVNLEAARLQELQESAAALAKTQRKRRDREIARQKQLVEEVQAFRDVLDQIAKRNLPIDLNDGIVLAIAPLHELTPWKEAATYWKKLQQDEYPWSAIGQSLRQQGLLKTSKR
jgi:hypothetical protein